MAIVQYTCMPFKGTQIVGTEVFCILGSMYRYVI